MSGEECVTCLEIIELYRWKQAIGPRRGFVADAKPKDVPMRKPDKIYRSDDFYIVMISTLGIRSAK